MKTPPSRYAAPIVAAIFAVDSLLHLYWASGARWPAESERGLSRAILGWHVSFGPETTLPLAAMLAGVAALVYAAHRRGWNGRLRPVARPVVLAVTVGAAVRVLIGTVWCFGIGVETETSTYWFNLLVATPVCLVLAIAGYSVLRSTTPATAGRARIWARHTALAVPLALVAAMMVGAYGYTPAEEGRGYRPPERMTSRYVDTEVARFHYLREGSGPPIVLIPGGTAWSFAWEPQLEALARDHTVYVVDLPGQGFTRANDPEFAYDLPAMNSAIDAFLNAVDLPVTTLGGHSWSGGWALSYAQHHPDRVDRLVLLSPSGLDVSDPLSWELLKPPILGELLMNLPYGRADAAESLRGIFVNDERITEEVVEAMWAPNTFTENRQATYLLERELDWSRTENALPGTRQPTLIIWGAQDTVTDADRAGRFAALMPNATVRIIDGCGHAATLDCPTEVTAHMKAFLS